MGLPNYEVRSLTPRGEMSDLLIHANVLNTLLNQSFISRLSKPVNGIYLFSISMFATGLFIVAAHRGTTSWLILLGAGLFIVHFGFTVVVFKSMGIWVDFVNPAIVIGICSIVTLVYLSYIELAAALAQLKVEQDKVIRLAKHEGFIRDWLLLGPIPWDDDATRLREDQLKATENQPGGATEDIQKVLTPWEGARGSGLAKALRWTLHNSGNKHINLQSVYHGQRKRFEKAVVYAFTSVKVPRTQTVSLLVGSDDGIAVWLNHEVVHSNDVTRGASPDQDTIHSLTLKEGWNSILIKCVNRDDGWGFYARFTTQKPFTETEFLTNLEVAPESQELHISLAESSFLIHLSQGLHNIALPLKPKEPYTARSLAEMLGATLVVEYNEVDREFSPFLPTLDTTNGFQVKGGFGYIVNLVADTDATFTGTAWSNAAPSSDYQPSGLWAFAVGGIVSANERILLPDDLTVTISNRRTGEMATGSVGSAGVGRFTVTFVDLAKRDVVKLEDEIEIALHDASGNIVAGPIRRAITLDDLRNASLLVNLRMGDIIPKESQLGQNYPNPFNPETWIPYQLASDADVTVRIYDVGGRLVRAIDLGRKAAGVYHQRARAAYWNGRNDQEEQVASGVYLYRWCYKLVDFKT